MHGGKTKIGPLNHSYKHGRFSKYLPARMAEFLTGLGSYDTLDLTDRIKVLDARFIDLIKRADSGESGELWKRLKLEWDKTLEAKAKGDMSASAAALNEIGALITQGLSDWNLWDRIEESIVKTTKVVESQRKRAVENQEMLTAQTVREMMRAIMEGLKSSVNEHVKDTTVRNAIFASASSEFTRLVGSRDRGLVDTRNH